MVIDNLKMKELKSYEKFKEDNPEVNLPSNVEIEELVHDFPPLNGVVLDTRENDDRSLLECKRPE